MNSFYCFIILIIPLALAYPNRHPNDFDHLLDMYARERSMNIDRMNHARSNEEHLVRRQSMFPLPYKQQNLPQMQPVCLPHIWTCGPDLPPCCPGLMCYDGNAKRGRHCVARG